MPWAFEGFLYPLLGPMYPLHKYLASVGSTAGPSATAGREEVAPRPAQGFMGDLAEAL